MTRYLEQHSPEAESLHDHTSAPGTDPEPAAVPSSPTAPTPATAPAPAKKRSLSRAAWLALVVGVIVLVFMLIFILQNNSPAQFTLLAWSFTTPMGVAMLFAAIAGALVTAMVGTIRMIVLGRSVRRLQRASEVPHGAR
jgi:uncharacterized integral membrane protein